MVSGASVCPMKIDAATFRLSAPLAPMRRVITLATALHDHLHHPEVVEDREERGHEDDGGQDLEGEDEAERRRSAGLARHDRQLAAALDPEGAEDELGAHERRGQAAR